LLHGLRLEELLYMGWRNVLMREEDYLSKKSKGADCNQMRFSTGMNLKYLQKTYGRITKSKMADFWESEINCQAIYRALKKIGFIWKKDIRG